MAREFGKEVAKAVQCTELAASWVRWEGYMGLYLTPNVF